MKPLVDTRPIIYLIRHARSVYNESQAELQQKNKELSPHQLQQTEQYHKMKFGSENQDCDITEAGEPQCHQCRQKMKDIDLDLIIVSPLRRALSTCARVFEGHKSQAPVIVDPAFREIFQSKCDIGSRLRESMFDYPQFDYSLIQNPEFWYIDSLNNQQWKSKMLQKLKNVDQKQLNKTAQSLMLQYLKDLWARRQKDPKQKSQALSPITAQKQKLRQLLTRETTQDEDEKQKPYRSIAIVTHSENIKSYTGIKPPNCSIMIYRMEYFDMPVDQVPRDFV